MSFPTDKKAYQSWLKAEAAGIKSDGCSKAKDWALRCCFEHDLSYYYGRDPRHCFRIFQDTGESRWDLADKIGYMESNNRFAGCLPWYLKYRWLAVTGGGWVAWKRHRQARP